MKSSLVLLVVGSLLLAGCVSNDSSFGGLSDEGPSEIRVVGISTEYHRSVGVDMLLFDAEYDEIDSKLVALTPDETDRAIHSFECSSEVDTFAVRTVVGFTHEVVKANIKDTDVMCGETLRIHVKPSGFPDFEFVRTGPAPSDADLLQIQATFANNRDETVWITPFVYGGGGEEGSACFLPAEDTQGWPTDFRMSPGERVTDKCSIYMPSDGRLEVSAGWYPCGPKETCDEMGSDGGVATVSGSSLSFGATVTQSGELQISLSGATWEEGVDTDTQDGSESGDDPSDSNDNGSSSENPGPSNAPPNASFSWSDTRTSGEIEFYDSSTDDNEVVSWEWKFGDGASSDERHAVHTYDEPGDYEVTLTVSDQEGATDSISKMITVEGKPPNAGFSWDPDEPGPGDEVSFSSRASVDQDGEIVGWDWDFGDGATSSEQDPMHIFESEGDYAVTLTVTDDDGETDSVTQTITVESEPPTAGFWWEPDEPGPGEAVSFDDMSHDRDGEVVSWEWDFGDGDTSTTQNPTHTFEKAGDYEVTLTVTDDDGAVDSTTQTVSVSD